MRDCALLAAEGKNNPTFADIGLPEMPDHSEWPKDIYSFFKDSSFSEPIAKNHSCYSLAAKPMRDELTWFSITGDMIKKCGDSSKPHCEEGNTW
ncbi:hypothetical protein [Prochlorococcus marinus]|uniref:Uncharacterized protein n=1 Tax=Prochlorococcus marinus (strain MIT 9211) TaxID=93059 RepID=A9BEL3_PROM4|nr:hypothetical protein [Prochlorococcus marinus]ABX08523.1 Hypothetical protein P9211_05921 [Prochlorococcus marinus str. MIT 9211]